ncbi:response regulator transcription factor [Azospirillum sp.]|uniref:response regulator transcription factor n=1 Tax=Azospirillum sp. TaxID=34012 RepID=UPI002D4B1532|nr:response regulator transcription factor [Azospirillum sp.]HYD71481.1 response regulator transcription factor [Azospirillum sp.]
MEQFRAEDVRARLIVVEDDPVTRSMIASYFAREGFLVDEAANGGECRQLMRRTKPDLLLVDIHLPDGSGLQLAQEIRAESAVGIIFVTQQDSETDRIVGLELAGDDYVTKPVNLRELLARTRALLRRRTLERGTPRRNSIVAFGPWLIDLTRRELAVRDGAVIQLTRAEFDLLAALAEADGRPLSREYLIEVVSNRTLAGDLRTVDTLVGRLRRKLVPADDGQPVIVTVPGIGYKLGAKTEAPS